MAVYCASKAYVLFISEALANEVRNTGVSVTALCPGVTCTGFQARAGVGQTRLVSMGSMSVEQVAKIGYRALVRGKPVVVPGLMNKLMAFAGRLLPRSVLTRVARSTMEAVK
jgi:short-subunit dehydrogenase